MCGTGSAPDRAGAGRTVYGLRGAYSAPEEGYLTVFTALILAVLLPFLLLLIRSSATGTGRLRTACAAQTAADSVLAEFHQELHARYDLFYIDTAYAGDSAPGPAAAAAHLQYYLQKNLEDTGWRRFYALKASPVQITGFRLASDDGGRSLREQIYAYMSADPVGQYAAAAMVTADRWHGLELDTEAWTRKRLENEDKLREQLARGEEEKRLAEAGGQAPAAQPAEGSGGDPGAAESEETLPQRILSAAGDFMKRPILFQIYGTDIPAADTLYPVAELCSHRTLCAGTGAAQTNSHGYPQADELLFDEYVLEKCGDLLHGARKEAPLRYQVEYIIGGRGSDVDNLEAVAERLMLLRGGLNCACLFGDTARAAQADAAAAVVSLVLFNPELKEPLKAGILFSWAYLETVVDVRTLMKGGRVPLRKTPDNWQTAMTDLLTPAGRGRIGSYAEGFDYRDHLRGLLYLQGGSLKTRRLMDLIEMEIRETPHGEGFRLDQCMDIFSFTTEVPCSTGTTFKVEMTVGYD